jgi:hypothetical protein
MKAISGEPMAKQKNRTRPAAAKEELTGEKFDAMTPEQRERVFAELEAETPEQREARSKRLNAGERAWWKKWQKKATAGRPKLGRHGTQIVSITVEKDLLKQVDSYAKAQGMKRSELFARSVAEKIGAEL